MCELMGLSFARPISADFSIHEFALRSEENADGWGLAWYPDRSVAVIKEPLAWHESKFTRFLETYDRLISRTYIAHVRHRTVGGAPTRADTHPFSREFGGRDWSFAHNGTLDILGKGFATGRFSPVGGTDSERAFCYVMSEIALQMQDAKRGLDSPEDWQWLHEKLATLNQMGKFNCLFSDGERLFCYHDRNGYKGMSRCRVHFRHNDARRFADELIGVDLESDRANHGYVIATRPLSTHGWEPFEPGELAVLEAGVLSYSTRRELTTS